MNRWLGSSLSWNSNFFPLKLSLCLMLILIYRQKKKSCSCALSELLTPTIVLEKSFPEGHIFLLLHFLEIYMNRPQSIPIFPLIAYYIIQVHKFVILTHFFNIFLVYTSLGCPFKNCIICPLWVDFSPDFKYLMFTFIKRDSFSFFLLSGYFICSLLLFSQLIFLRIYFMIGSLLKFFFSDYFI